MKIHRILKEDMKQDEIKIGILRHIAELAFVALQFIILGYRF